jgi:hypothetical protein
VPAGRVAVLRILVGAYVVAWSLARLPEHLASAGQPDHRWQPVGVWALVDGPPARAVVVALAVATPVLGLLFAAGRWFRIAGPACAVALLALATLDSSWGQIFHTENLVVLHVGILALAPGVADALVLGGGRGGRGGRARSESAGAYGWPVGLCAVVVVIAYVVAGVAKLRGEGLGWASGDALRNLVAYDNLRKQLLGDTYSPLGSWIVGQGWAFGPLAVATLAVELGAGVALLGGRWRTAWVVGAWLFHLGVLLLMAIVFPYQLSGIAFAAFFPLERLPERLRRRARPPGPLVHRTGGRAAGIEGRIDGRRLSAPPSG